MKILVVDDHTPLRFIVRRLLEAPGRTFTEAASGEECVDQIVGHDVVFLDIHMPGIGGLEALEEARRRAPDTPIWMLSSSDDANDIAAAKAHGATGYLVKQSDAATMKAALEAALAHAGGWVVMA